MNKIGICMLTGAFYPEISGAGMQAYNLTRCLNNEFNFYIITTCKNFTLPREENIHRIQVYRIMVKPNKLIWKICSFFQFLHAFLKIRRKIDILHLHGFSQKTLLFIFLGKMFRKKIIQKMTNIGEDDSISITKQKFGKIKLMFFSKADIFISVCPALTMAFNRLLLPRLKKKLYEIPNGVDTKKFTPPKDINSKILLRRKLGLPENKRIIIFIGIFSYRKGIDLLLDAWKKIRSHRENNISLLFIGSTDTSYFEINANLIERIKDEIKKYGMNEVFFVEETLEVEEYYRASDIFILPSRREGLPNALLEAMSSGLACIVTRLDGITDYIIKDKEDGLLFEKNNAEELQTKLVDLLHNEKFISELGCNARKKVLKKFSIEEIATRYSHLYKDLVFSTVSIKPAIPLKYLIRLYQRYSILEIYSEERGRLKFFLRKIWRGLTNWDKGFIFKLKWLISLLRYRYS